MNVEELWKIPNNWAWTKLKDLGEVVAGGTPSTKEADLWGDTINWISPADLTGYSKKTIARGAKSLSQKGLKNSSAKLMPAGSIHFSSRAPIGYVVISSEPITTNQGFKSLVPAPGVFSEYVYYYLKGSKQLAEKRASGTTFLELSGKAFGLLPLPIPPLNEQRRIVAKIEELFSELDKGVESLKTAREQLKIYRQAVLKHAFEGKLTAQWREANKDKLESPEQLLARIQQEREALYQQQLTDWQSALKIWEKNGKAGKKPGKPKESKKLASFNGEELEGLSQLPENWLWVRVADLGDVQLGRQRSPKNRSKDYPAKYIRAANLTDTGLDLSDVLDMEFTPDEKSRYLLQFGDVVLSEASGSASQVGKPAVWKCQLDECCFQNTVIRVQPPLVYSDYLFWVFKAYYITGVFSREAGGVGINHLSAGKLANLAIPITSCLEAQEILNFVSEKLSAIQYSEDTIAKELAKAETLRQSILKKAFSGQLVPQDPTDEPAAVLLDRIRAAKAAQPKATKKPRRGKTPSSPRSSVG
jgi:type I restriction enzyme S subunit